MGGLARPVGGLARLAVATVSAPLSRVSADAHVALAQCMAAMTVAGRQTCCGERHACLPPLDVSCRPGKHPTVNRCTDTCAPSLPALLCAER